MERIPRSPDSSKNVIIDGMAWDRIASILEKFANLSVSAPLQMQDVPGGRALSIQLPEQGFWALLTSSSQDGSNKRWKYAWSEAYKTSAGYGSGWSTLPNGRTGTTSTNTAYNSIENINGASGAYGNGVTSTNLTGTIDIKAIPNNTPIFLRPVRTGTTLEYWFSISNGVDGGC